MYKHYANLVFYRAYVDLKGERAQSYLGMVWWVLEPLLYMVIFYTVFELLFQRGGEGFVGFLLCGLVFWRWFDNSVKRMSSSVVASANLITQVKVPKLVFPLTELAANTARFFFVLIIFLVFAVFYLPNIPLTWAYLPLVLLTEAIMITGFGLLLAAVVPMMPDLRKLIDSALMLLFYMSGIFFNIAATDEKYQDIFYLNPIAVQISLVRRVLLDGIAPDMWMLLYPSLTGLVLTIAGIFIIRKNESRYPKLLSK